MRYGICVSTIWDEDAGDGDLTGPFATFEEAWDAANAFLKDGVYSVDDRSMAGTDAVIFPVAVGENFNDLSGADVTARDSVTVWSVISKLVEHEKPTVAPTLEIYEEVETEEAS